MELQKINCSALARLAGVRSSLKAETDSYPTRTRQIAVMGTPVNCGNRGVLALGASIINLCTQASPDSEVVLLLDNLDSQPVLFRVGKKLRPVSIVHCRLSPRCHPQNHLFCIVLMSLLYRGVPITGIRAAIARSTPWIKTVVEADFVGDVRGGDSFSDLYGMKRFLFDFLMVGTVLLVKGEIVQFPQTYGPYKSPLARWLARFILKRSSVIIARDPQSQQMAQDLVGPKKRVLLSPDVAFSLSAIQPERIELNPPLAGSVPKGVIGLNVNGLMAHGGYTRNNMFGLKMDYATFLPELVRSLLAEHFGELWIIPHTYAPRGDVESDNEASQELRDSLPPDLRQRVRLVTAEYDQHELKGIIGRCDFFIGSRMHSCIAALSQGVPCVGVAYSRKFVGVFESVGMAEWVVDARFHAQDIAVARIIALFHQRNEVRQELSKRAALARQQLTTVFRELVSQQVPAPQAAPEVLNGVGRPALVE